MEKKKSSVCAWEAQLWVEQSGKASLLPEAMIYWMLPVLGLA